MARLGIKALGRQKRADKISKRKHCGEIKDIHGFWSPNPNKMEIMLEDKDEVKEYEAQRFE